MNVSLLSLGANQQDPIRYLNIASKHIQSLPKTFICQSSKIIQTPAFGVTQQQHFYNQVIEIKTELPPFQLLNFLQKIEIKMGRVRKIPWGPRLIDIDILVYNNISLQHPKLTLPHPQIYTRAFIQELIKALYSK